MTAIQSTSFLLIRTIPFDVWPMSSIDDLRRTMARLRARMAARGTGADAPDARPLPHRRVQRAARHIDRTDLPHMREELGDVLIQVVFHAQLAAERGDFDFDDVAARSTRSSSAPPARLWRRPGQHIRAGHRGLGKVKGRREGRGGKDGSAVFKHLPPAPAALMSRRRSGSRSARNSCRPEASWTAPGCRSLRRGSTSALGRMLFEITAAARNRGSTPRGAAAGGHRVMRGGGEGRGRRRPPPLTMAVRAAAPTDETRQGSNGELRGHQHRVAAAVSRPLGKRSGATRLTRSATTGRFGISSAGCDRTGAGRAASTP